MSPLQQVQHIDVRERDECEFNCKNRQLIFAIAGHGRCLPIKGIPKTLLMLPTPSSSVLPRSTPNGQLNLNGMRILVVDDDRNTLYTLSELLSSYHAEVRTAESVAAALAVFRSWAPEVLLSDLGMPEQDGYDLIRTIHTLPYGLLRMAIAITGFSRDEDRERALAAGYDIFLTKPVELEQLISLIGEVNRS